MEQLSFGHWLKLKRKALDLTREQLAARVGYSAATIRKIEDEERHPSAQVVERLAEIFNIPQTERPLFFKFARGEVKSASAQNPEDIPWRASTRPTPTNLPAPTTALIGREPEITHVRDYLQRADIRLVTLIGPPGIGKTRLSIEAARGVLPDFPDGVFFVALAPRNDPNLISATVSHALGYVGAIDISTTEQLKEGIADKRLLLVLDNCEHLIEDVASLASDLLAACPHLKILATSRESLRIPGEWSYSVPALDVPAFDLPADKSSLSWEGISKYPALALFAERARAVRSDFSLNADNIEAVAAICARLDGLPLAIELISARMRLMSAQALLDRLSPQLILTVDGMRAASERQKTLHNAIDWSYHLLLPEEQRLFAYLSVFSGSFPLEAVEAMFSGKVIEKPVSTLIALLLDKSLLKLVPSLGIEDEPRYSMLVTIQEYARECLRVMEEKTEVRNVYLSYFLHVVEKADQELRGHNQLQWLSRLNAERDNLRAALEWAIETGQTELALQMTCNLHWFWFVRGDHNEGRQWFERVLAMPVAPMYPESQAYALTQLAHHLFLLGHRFGPQNQELPLLRLVAEQALSIARAQRNKHNMARALAMLGLDLVEQMDFPTAQSAFEQSQALYQEVQDEWGYAHAVMCLGYEFNTQESLASALALYEKALAVFKKLGDRFFICVTLRGIAMLQTKQNNLASAVAALREALPAAQQLESKYEIAPTLSWWGEVEKRLGNPARAVCLYWAAKNVYDSMGAWQTKDEHEFENELASCRAALEELEFAAAVEEGRAMTMEQAIAYALEDDGS